MADRQPTIRKATIAEAEREFRRLAKQVSKGSARILVEDDGTPLAAIVSARDLETLSGIESEHRQDFAVLDEMRAAFRDVPAEEIEREVAKAMAEVREDMRAERKGHLPDSSA